MVRDAALHRRSPINLISWLTRDDRLRLAFVPSAYREDADRDEAKHPNVRGDHGISSSSSSSPLSTELSQLSQRRWSLVLSLSAAAGLALEAARRHRAADSQLLECARVLYHQGDLRRSLHLAALVAQVSSARVSDMAVADSPSSYPFSTSKNEMTQRRASWRALLFAGLGDEGHTHTSSPPPPIRTAVTILALILVHHTGATLNHAPQIPLPLACAVLAHPPIHLDAHTRTVIRDASARTLASFLTPTTLTHTPIRTNTNMTATMTATLSPTKAKANELLPSSVSVPSHVSPMDSSLSPLMVDPLPQPFGHGPPPVRLGDVLRAVAVPADGCTPQRVPEGQPARIALLVEASGDAPPLAFDRAFAVLVEVQTAAVALLPMERGCILATPGVILSSSTTLAMSDAHQTPYRSQAWVFTGVLPQTGIFQTRCLLARGRGVTSWVALDVARLPGSNPVRLVHVTPRPRPTGSLTSSLRLAGVGGLSPLGGRMRGALAVTLPVRDQNYKGAEMGQRDQTEVDIDVTLSRSVDFSVPNGIPWTDERRASISAQHNHHHDIRHQHRHGLRAPPLGQGTVNIALASWLSPNSQGYVSRSLDLDHLTTHPRTPPRTPTRPPPRTGPIPARALVLRPLTDGVGAAEWRDVVETPGLDHQISVRVAIPPDAVAVVLPLTLHA